VRAFLFVAMCLAAACTPAARSDPAHPSDFTIWNRHMDDAAGALRQARYADAEKSLEAALGEARAFAPDDTRLAINLMLLGYVHMSQLRFGEAYALAQRALPILEQNLGPDNAFVGLGLIVIGTYQVISGQPTRAEPVLRRAVLVAEKAYGKETGQVAFALSSLALVYVAKLAPAMAEPIVRRAVRIAEEIADSALLRAISVSVVALADLYSALASPSDAEPLYRKALMMRETALGRDHAEVGEALERYARFLRRMQRESEAERLEERARAIKAAQKAPTPIR
jgi:tetratricopeptide (TPR) repeat protein